MVLIYNILVKTKIHLPNMAYFHIYMDHVSNLIGLQIDFQFIINRYIANPKIKRKYIQQYFPAHSKHRHIKSIHDSPSQVSRSCHDINITNIFNTLPNIFAASGEVLLPRPPQPDCVGLGRWQRCRPVPARPAARRGRGGDLTPDFRDTKRISATYPTLFHLHVTTCAEITLISIRSTK